MMHPVNVAGHCRCRPGYQPMAPNLQFEVSKCSVKMADVDDLSEA